jgi:DNA-binding response OmpR family regulator
MNGHHMLSEDSGLHLPQHASMGVAADADCSAETVTASLPEKKAAPSATEHRLLIVEDDVPLARLLSTWLGMEGFAATVVSDAEAALAALREQIYSLVLLDLNLPGMDGVAALEQMHAQWPELPIFVLTGRSGREDLVVTLNGGADDFLVKPFSLVELLARTRALLRRRGRAVAMPAVPVLAEGLTLNRDEYRVERDGRRIELTPREFALLDYLMQHSPRPVSRAKLMEEVWRVPFDPSTNIVDVYMKYLRDKIDCASEKKLIRTVRGVGYALACA